MAVSSLASLTLLCHRWLFSVIAGSSLSSLPLSVIPAKAGIQKTITPNIQPLVSTLGHNHFLPWMPAFAGMTKSALSPLPLSVIPVSSLSSLSLLCHGCLFSVIPVSSLSSLPLSVIPAKAGIQKTTNPNIQPFA
jgi:hypothetical protein